MSNSNIIKALRIAIEKTKSDQLTWEQSGTNTYKVDFPKSSIVTTFDGKQYQFIILNSRGEVIDKLNSVIVLDPQLRSDIRELYTEAQASYLEINEAMRDVFEGLS